MHNPGLTDMGPVMRRLSKFNAISLPFCRTRRLRSGTRIAF